MAGFKKTPKNKGKKFMTPQRTGGDDEKMDITPGPKKGSSMKTPNTSKNMKGVSFQKNVSFQGLKDSPKATFKGKHPPTPMPKKIDTRLEKNSLKEFKGMKDSPSKQLTPSKKSKIKAPQFSDEDSEDDDDDDDYDADDKIDDDDEDTSEDDSDDADESTDDDSPGLAAFSNMSKKSNQKSNVLAAKQKMLSKKGRETKTVELIEQSDDDKFDNDDDDKFDDIDEDSGDDDDESDESDDHLEDDMTRRNVKANSSKAVAKQMPMGKAIKTEDEKSIQKINSERNKQLSNQKKVPQVMSPQKNKEKVSPQKGQPKQINVQGGKIDKRSGVLQNACEEIRKKDRDSRKLFVRGLPADVSAEELKALSSDIIDVHIPHRGRSKKHVFAFLEFTNEKMTEKNYTALKDKKFRGKELFIDFCGEKSVNYKQRLEKLQEPKRFDKLRLSVLDLPIGTNIVHLANLFPNAIQIFLSYTPDYRNASVLFKTEEDAEAALKKNDNAKIEGKPVTVLMAVVRSTSRKRKRSRVLKSPFGKKVKLESKAESVDDEFDDNEEESD